MSRPSRAPIAVIVRTLGDRARLREALASLAGQSCTGFETVLVDMSREGMDAEARRLEARGVPVHHLRVGAPLARPAALNAGIAAATADAISILDEDNLYDPDQLARFVAGLSASGADLVYTGVRHVTYGVDGQPLDARIVNVPFRADRLLLSNYIYATGTAFRRELWQRLGGYDERLTVFEDWDFLIRAAARGTVFHDDAVRGESRKFTGLPGVSTFDLESRLVGRCLAGVYWKHRRRYHGALLDELKVVWMDHCRRMVRPRAGWWGRAVGGWRLEQIWDLCRWWLSAAVSPPGRNAA